MTERNDGGSAFPSSDLDPLHGVSGMTLRDYFAAQAMAAIIAKLSLMGTDPEGIAGILYSHDGKRAIMAQVAAGAYGYADAMLEARK